MKNKVKGLLAGAALFSAAGAQAALIDFEAFPIGPLAGDTLVTSAGGVGVTFSGLGLNIRTLPGAFTGAGNVLSTQTDFQQITVDFDQAVNNLSFRNWISGNFTPEIDNINVDVFDINNVLLGSVSTSTDLDVAIPFAGVGRLQFDDFRSTGYVLDNIQFDSVSVPEPAMLALFGLGLAGLGFARRKS